MAPRLGLGGGVTADPASGLFGAPNLLLDNFPGAHRAYSVRKLSKDYSGFAMKVRRTDNEEADVAFDDNGRVSGSSMIANPSGGVSVTDLDTFVGSGGTDHAFVTLWYDQSGEGSNADDADVDYQPKLYNAGSLITVNSRAAVLFDGTDDHLGIDESGLSFGSVTTFAVFKHGSTSGTRVPWGLSNASGNFYLHLMYGADMYYYDTGNIAGHSVDTDQHFWTYEGAVGTNKQTIFMDGAASTASGDSDKDTSFSDVAGNGLGGYEAGTGGSSFSWQGHFQEFIVYDSDQISNRSDIESDIDTEYDIS